MTMPQRYKIGSTDEISDGSRLITEINGQEIAVFQIDGKYYALANYCVHQAGPLCEGKTTGATYIDENGWDWKYDDSEEYIACPWHGWLFDIKNGENVHNSKYRVPTYNVEVNNGEIFVIR